ncbi:transmembrane amino acid transporter protein-domain-containing protein [Paraphoma chrysanthemicola]|uniref:Transmembrane amino acid transporter protein-domain-containing protein n=1 Tax=Paraphoma chrysanthemicola TaxID=798071 RepID=A0A8K0RHN6_9PLEO|nr:transmembrane amino acid transporter protein-domain-containing protein [Paraphoma chrysanthemicola]
MAATNLVGGRQSASSMETIRAPRPGATEKKDSTEQGLLLQTSNASDIEAQPTSPAETDVFGNEEGADVQYKTCEWWHTSILMLAENVSLGVLALPQALAILGLVPGLLCILFLGVIATYTGWIIGEFRLAHPAMHSFADCGMLIAGPIGREIMAVGQVLILVFIMGAHVLSFAIAMNAITDHSACTIIFSVVGLVICFLLGLPRTFKNVSYFSIFSCLSIIIAVLVVMIAIGIQKPDMGNVLAVRPNVPLVKGLGPVLNIILAYTGHVAFFSFQAELKDTRDFKKALFLEQGIAVVFYMVMSVVIYYYAGPLVASPALGSAGPTITKIAFGIALPTIIVAGVVNGSVACKYIYVRIWAGTNVVHQNSFKSIGSWLAICAAAWVVSWILAEAIPNFNIFLGLIGALFGSWFSYALPPCLWLYQHRSNLFSTKRKTAMTIFNCTVFFLGVAIFVLGMWSSGVELSSGSGGRPFSCANNWKPTSWVAEDQK